MNPQRKQFLDELKARGAILFANAREQLSKFAADAEANDTEDRRKELIALVRASLSDPVALQELNRLRTLVVDNIVTAKSNAASFFSKVNLAEDEEPEYTNETGQIAKARVIGQDGKPHLIQAMKQMMHTLIPLEWVSTRILEYPIIDVYRGRIGADILKAIPLAEAIVRELDAKLWTLIKALPQVTYTTTGAEMNRTFVLDPRIVPGNVPTGNVINMAAENKFNFNVIKAVMKYFIQIQNIFGTTAIVPEAIFVPALDASGFIDDVSLTSDGNNPAVKQIFEGGYVTNFAGKSIIIVSDPTLDPADKAAYVRTNQPIGEYYAKPSLDVSYPDSPSQISAKMIKENKGEAFQKKIFGAVTPLPWTVRMAKVIYKT